jgi:hypothetical protein
MVMDGSESQNADTKELRDFLRLTIENLEARIFRISLFGIEAAKSGLLDISISALGNSNPAFEHLSNLYLEYALASQGEESIVYAHRAVALNSKIQIQQRFIFLRDYSALTLETGAEKAMAMVQHFYSTDRTPEHMHVLQAFLDAIKGEAEIRGKEALVHHEKIFNLIKKGEIPDPYTYSRNISELADDEFEDERIRVAQQETGIGSFLSEMLLSREEESRAKERWKEGKHLPSATFKQLSQIYSKEYPKHTIIHKDALGGIRLVNKRKFETIDTVCDDICLEIAKRLPRRLDAYRFRQDYASDELNTDGLGKINVELSQTGDGIFTYVHSVEGDNFSITNSRPTGRKYLDICIDFAFPHRIRINPLGLELTLYDDDSGIFITKDDVEYTNNRCEALGSGMTGDSHRDQMYRKGRRLDFSVSDDDYEQKISRVKPDLSWKKESKKIAGWLKENVLEKIISTSVYDNQATTLPESISYPDSMGPLYSWIKASLAEKIELTGGDVSKLYPHEKAALSPGWRLVNLGIHGDFPQEAHNGFIWCGIGIPKENSSADDYMIPGHHMDSDFGDYRNKLVQIKPKDGEEVYVVDYQAWDDFREKAATDYLSDKEYNDMHIALAKTLIPVSQYKENYKKPVVLISRNLGLDEVTIVPGVEYKPKSYRRKD